MVLWDMVTLGRNTGLSIGYVIWYLIIMVF